MNEDAFLSPLYKKKAKKVAAKNKCANQPINHDAEFTPGQNVLVIIVDAFLQTFENCHISDPVPHPVLPSLGRGP